MRPQFQVKTAFWQVIWVLSFYVSELKPPSYSSQPVHSQVCCVWKQVEGLHGLPTALQEPCDAEEQPSPPGWLSRLVVKKETIWVGKGFRSERSYPHFLASVPGCSPQAAMLATWFLLTGCREKVGDNRGWVLFDTNRTSLFFLPIISPLPISLA